jgi:hypothetical protein
LLPHSRINRRERNDPTAAREFGYALLPAPSCTERRAITQYAHTTHTHSFLHACSLTPSSPLLLLAVTTNRY